MEDECNRIFRQQPLIAILLDTVGIQRLMPGREAGLSRLVGSALYAAVPKSSPDAQKGKLNGKLAPE